MSDWLGALIGAVERTATRLATHKRPKRNPIQQVVTQARQAGIHPLVAIQGGFTGQPAYGSQIDWSSDLGFGQAIGGFADSLFEQDQLQKEQAREDKLLADERAFQERMNAPDPAREKLNAANLRLAEAQASIAEQQLHRITNDLNAAAKGATTGGNSSNPETFNFGGIFPVGAQGATAQEAENIGGEAGGESQGAINMWTSVLRDIFSENPAWAKGARAQDEVFRRFLQKLFENSIFHGTGNFPAQPGTKHLPPRNLKGN